MAGEVAEFVKYTALRYEWRDEQVVHVLEVLVAQGVNFLRDLEVLEADDWRDLHLPVALRRHLQLVLPNYDEAAQTVQVKNSGESKFYDTSATHVHT